MKNTFYGQFAAGKNAVEAKETVAADLRESGIRTMLCIPMESPLHKLSDP